MKKKGKKRKIGVGKKRDLKLDNFFLYRHIPNSKGLWDLYLILFIHPTLKRTESFSLSRIHREEKERERGRGGG